MVEWLKFNSGEEYLSSNPSGDLMNLLVDKTRAAGRKLTFEEVSSDATMFQPRYYAVYFISFEKIAEEAWLKTQSADSESLRLKFVPQPVVKEVLLEQEIVDLDQDLIARLKSGQHASEKRYHQKYSTDEVKKLVGNFYQKYGRMPTWGDANFYYKSILPSWPTIVKVLGPKSEWLKLISA